MEDSQLSVIPETQQDEEQIDNEIATIRAQIKSLAQRRSLLTSALLTSKSSQSLLDRAELTTSASSTLKTRSQDQAKHDQQRLYRMCAGATMFEARDPDPHAVDNGRILGIRIEAFSRGKFLTPYYLLLNRPHTDSQALRVHRHTAPSCIPLSALVSKYLPTPPPAAAGTTPSKPTKPQNLPRLVRELRREIVSYHLRKDAIEKLRDGLVGADGGVSDVKATDAELRDIRIEWTDEAVGRARIGKDGTVEKVVVVGEGGRSREMERKLLGGDRRVEGLAERLGDVEKLS
ncbi:hypothetical protein MMC08_005399 [Hypocenomyce scalaris]|nr:hypothetical protein [Hypocenomyce scalaris]